MNPVIWGEVESPGEINFLHKLGINKIHLPCSWEKIAPLDLESCHWEELDSQLEEAKLRQITVIASFIQHGNGPDYTNPIDPEFPEKLASFARQFITRYPWINDFTPINEINSKARFSCLQGYWYPHLKSNLYYLKSLILQCQATVLAMREIKKINPNAKLLQTENIGKCLSTEPLVHQRDFENERRWLAIDLLSGKIDTSHHLYSFFKNNGISDQELLWFQENQYTPDMLGINHHPQSSNFLDHRYELYPECYHTYHEKNRYADLLAIDSGEAILPSPEEIFREVWNKYQIPMAITECVITGPRESQMRWLNDIWQTTRKLKSEGIKIEAITVANLAEKNCLTTMVRELAANKDFHSPLLSSEGVWKTPRRIKWAAKHGEFTRLYHHSEARPIIIAGTPDILGDTFSEICGARNIFYRMYRTKELDTSDIDSLEEILDLYRPWAFINGSDDIRGQAHLTRICKEKRIQLLNINENFETTTLDFAHDCLNILIDQEFRV